MKSRFASAGVVNSKMLAARKQQPPCIRGFGISYGSTSARSRSVVRSLVALKRDLRERRGLACRRLTDNRLGWPDLLQDGRHQPLEPGHNIAYMVNQQHRGAAPVV